MKIMKNTERVFEAWLRQKSDTKERTGLWTDGANIYYNVGPSDTCMVCFAQDGAILLHRAEISRACTRHRYSLYDLAKGLGKAPFLVATPLSVSAAETTSVHLREAYTAHVAAFSVRFAETWIAAAEAPEPPF
jgi:hypothetical protein